MVELWSLIQQFVTPATSSPSRAGGLPFDGRAFATEAKLKSVASAVCKDAATTRWPARVPGASS